MTFITVVRTGTFPPGSIEVELSGSFSGNLTGNVLNASIIQSSAGQFDTILASTLNGTITFSDDVCINAANVLQVDTINDKSGTGITIEGVSILNGEFTSNVCIDTAQYLQTDNIEAKGTLITVHDPILMSGTGDQIRFTNGIEIGSSGTSTSSATSIAIGKDAVSSAAGSVAIGHFANVYVTDDVQLGRNVGTTGAGILRFHGQIVSDESWADSNIGFAKIDGSGNLYKDTSGGGGSSGNASVFRIEQSATPQSITNGSVGGNIVLSVADGNNIDIPGSWASDTFTVSESGWYHLNAGVDYEPLDQQATVQFLINDAPNNCIGHSGLNSTPGNTFVSIDCTVYLNTFDTIKLHTSQRTSGAKNVYNSYFSIFALTGLTGTLSPTTTLENLCISGNLYVGNVFGKSPIHFHDIIDIKDTVAGGKITYEAGIEIGSATTSTNSATSIAIGKGAVSLAADSVAIGQNANVAVQYGVAIGTNALASGGNHAIAIGGGYAGLAAQAQAYGAIAIGYRAYADSNSFDSICIGRRANTNSYDNVVIGRQAKTYGYVMDYQGSYNVAIGRRAAAYYKGSVALGAFAGSYGSWCITIGYSAASGTQPYGIAIGYGANCGGNKSIAIGYNTSISFIAPDSIAFGTYSETSAPQSIAIGKDTSSSAGAFNGIAIGTDASITNGNAIAIGTGAFTAANDAVVIGRSGVTNGPSAIAIGYFSQIGGFGSVGVGASSETEGGFNTAIGGYSFIGGGMFPTHAVAIGYQANAYVTDDVQLGRNVGTTGAGILRFHGQIVSDESWADSNIGFAKIDGSGNLYKDPNGGGGGSGNASVFRIEQSATPQSITNGSVGGNIVLSVEDGNNIDAPGSWASDTFTVDASGWYHLNAGIEYEPLNQVATAQFLINDNPNGCIGHSGMNSTPGNAFVSIDCTVYLNSSDTIKLHTTQQTSGAKNVYNSYFSIFALTGVTGTVIPSGPTTILENLCITGNLFVGNVYGKSPIVVHDILDIKDTVAGGKITFEAGIEIGNTTTTTNTSTSIAIGRAVTSSGIASLAIGYNSTATGNNSVSIGYNAGPDVSTGYDNIAIGSRVMQDMTGSGSIRNIGVGPNTFRYFTSGTHLENIAIGLSAMGGAPGGKTVNTQHNVCIGSSAGSIINGGDENVCVGRLAGITLTGNRNVCIGRSSDAGAANNSVAIGYLTTTSGSSAIGIGRTATASANSNIAIGRYASANTGTYAIAIGGGGTAGNGPNATASNAITIGRTTTASSAGSIVIGRYATGTTGTYAIALGGGSSAGLAADATAADAIAIGRNTTASAANAVALGLSSTASSANAIAIGRYATATTGTYNLAIGSGSTAGNGADSTGTSSIAIGRNTASSAVTSLAIGFNSTANSNGSVSIGRNTNAITGAYCIAIGGGANAGEGADATAADAIAIGRGTTASAASVVSIGFLSTASSAGSISVGRYSTATTGTYAIAIGAGSSAGLGAEATAADAIAIGGNTTASASYAIAIGLSATASAADTVAIGHFANAYVTDDVQLGRNVGSTGSGILRFHAQTVSDESWADANIGFAKIDGSGNLYKDPNGGGGTETNSATLKYLTTTAGSKGDLVEIVYNDSMTAGVQKINPYRNPTFQWVNQIGNAATDLEKGRGICVDCNGNSYVIGFFANTITIGSTTLNTVTTAVNQNGDIFIAKLDRYGNWMWATQTFGRYQLAANQAQYHFEFAGISVDHAGNVYITSYFSGTSTFGTTTLTAAGTDIFVAKLDTYGGWLWVNQVVGNGGDNRGVGIATDSDGNSYITGQIQGTATFGTFTLTSVGSLDIFVAKIDTNGVWKFANKAGGTFDTVTLFERGWGICIDSSGNSYVIGTFAQEATFGTITLTTATGNRDIFITKVDTVGNWVWAKRGGSQMAPLSGTSTLDDIGIGIGVDRNGNVYATGYFQQTADFGTFTLTSTGTVDVFVVKLDNNGNWLWARSAGGTAAGGISDRGNALCVDCDGNSYITGYFSGTTTLTPTLQTSLIVNNGAVADPFVAKLDTNGNWIWAVTMTSDNTIDGGMAISIDAAKNIYVTGFFENTMTFGTITLTSTGNCAIFVAKLNESDLRVVGLLQENATLNDLVKVYFPGGTILPDTFASPLVPATNYYIDSSWQFSSNSSDAKRFLGVALDTTNLLTGVALGSDTFLNCVTNYCRH